MKHYLSTTLNLKRRAITKCIQCKSKKQNYTRDRNEATNWNTRSDNKLIWENGYDLESDESWQEISTLGMKDAYDVTKLDV